MCIRMFEIAPAVWTQFAWGEPLQPGEKLSENTTFVMFAKRFVGMLDMAIGMLGPDLEAVEGQLQHLGVRHINYGVMPKHYPLMGKALLNTIEHLLGDSFTEKLHDSWNSIYTFMSVTMMQGAFQDLDRIRNETIELKDAEARRQEKRADIKKNRGSSGRSRGSTRTRSPSTRARRTEEDPKGPRGPAQGSQLRDMATPIKLHKDSECTISTVGMSQDDSSSSSISDELLAFHNATSNKGPQKVNLVSSVSTRSRNNGILASSADMMKRRFSRGIKVSKQSTS